jgi:hypothetical protein
MPHVELFPANSKRKSVPMLGMPTVDGYHRFFKEYASLPNEISVEPLTLLDALNEASVVKMRIRDLSGELALKAKRYLDRLEEFLSGSVEAMRPDTPTPDPGLDSL